MDPRQRFSNLAGDYMLYRPSYPEEAWCWIAQRTGLRPQAVACDLGSGTGIATRALLERCARVYAVEPNAEMRAAAERTLEGVAGFVSVAGSAEATALAEQSIDLVVAAQSFHWFPVEPTRQELRRILKPGGYLALIWNERLVDASPFLAGLEALLLRSCVEYTQICHKHSMPESKVAEFFGLGGWVGRRFDNRQDLDWEGLRGRVRSYSYVPTPGQPGHASFYDDLRRLYDRHQVAGTVTIDYATRTYVGRLPPSP
jgi:SAM-dependent methyltransferase